jgi:hypothetical protein
VLAALAALAVAAPAQAEVRTVNAPTALRGFMLRATEASADSFARTPSFAWAPVPGATAYEVELANDQNFADGNVVWSGSVSRTPAISLPMTVPWMTGRPYALYAHVRAVANGGRSPWSPAFGFNMRPSNAPAKLKDHPGLIRWSPVDGATSYQVWFQDSGKVISTVTNAADEREYYSFHQNYPWPSVVRWRVRAVRTLFGSFRNGLPSVSYGPWSSTQISLNPTFAGGLIQLGSTLSGTSESSSDAIPHGQVPSFLWTGDSGYSGIGELYHVYVSTDRDCLNTVYRSAVVGSPAYAPRVTGPLALPAALADLGKARSGYLADGKEGTVTMLDGTKVTATEEAAAAAPTAETPPSSSSGFALPKPAGAEIDLWDSGWPNGRYWWTVVPVEIVQSEAGLVYRDLELPQDACAANRVASFGKQSQPVLASETSSVAYASGLSSDGKLVAAASAKQKFYGSPLVSWQPAVGAVAYEVQWSRKLYPWKSAAKPIFTFGSSALLTAEGGGPLAAGDWYYRVRGLNPYLPGPVKEMSWSEPVKLVIAKPTYKVVKPSVTKEDLKKLKGTKTLHRKDYTLAVPALWRWVDRGNLAAELKRTPDLKKDLNPKVLEDLVKPNSTLRLMAYDPSDHHNGLQVWVLPLGGHTHSAWAKNVQADLRKQPELSGAVACASLQLAAGPSLRCTYKLKVGTYLEEETLYAVDRPGSTFAVQFSAATGQRAKKAPLYRSLIKTLKIS